MGEERLPTLFEVLNRFSEPPVDLWSFYVFMNEQYGAVEYLDFWLDCAAHRNLWREFGKSHHRSKASQPSNRYSAGLASNRTSGYANSVLPAGTQLALQNQTAPGGDQTGPGDNSGSGGNHSGDSPSSSMLFDMLMDDVLNSSTENFDEQNDLGSTAPPIHRESHSHSQSSETTDAQIQQSQQSQQPQSLPQSQPPAQPPSQPPAHNTARPPTDRPQDGHYHPLRQNAQDPSEKRQDGPLTRQDIRESAQRIIFTYLTPGSSPELVLPADSGWSMSIGVRQVAGVPGGLDNPRMFDDIMAYVFEALEREAFPAFLTRRVLCNVQPVSSAVRLAGGLIALFGGFWLAFVFILLDWQPKYERCWVILPFGIGWYLTVTALWNLDPLLAAAGLGERDGGGVWKLRDQYVRKLIMRRSVFVMLAVILLAAAFCVLFIFVPGYRL